MMNRNDQTKQRLQTVKPANLWRTSRRLLSYASKSVVLVLFTILAAVAGTVMQVVTPKLLGNTTTMIFEGIGGGSGIDFQRLRILLILILLLYAGVFIATFLQERLMTLVSQKTVYRLRNELKEKLNRVPVSFYDKHSNGSLMSVAVNDMDNIVTNLQQSLTSFITTVITVVGVLGFMLMISWKLTLLACVMIPGSMLVMKLFTPRTRKNNSIYMKKLGDLNGQIEESFQGFDVIKSFNQEEKARKTFNKINDEMYEAGWRAKFFGGTMMPSMMLVQNLIYVLIAASGAASVVSGVIRIGDMQAFLQYSQQFSSPVAKLSQIWSGLLAAVASAERVFEILDAEEIEEELPVMAEQPVISTEIEKIVFDQVAFGYSDELLMKNFNLKVENGQMIAIVGHTGAGKTTLINLMERFYEIRKGSIRIDGSDIRSCAPDQVRRQMGMVLQDIWLFSGTIYENILFGNPQATKDEVYAAAKAAYADDFIRKLPDGYNTLLGEDAANISQGQKQLITIARAFVANPEILILDEATSNVDSRTELIIQKAMRRLQKGRTSFVVAHRLSTIYDADNIVVMKNGDIIETGTHRQLIADNGEYAEIYNSQFNTETEVA